MPKNFNICSKCGKKIKLSFENCPYCGSSVSAAPITEPQNNENIERTTVPVQTEPNPQIQHQEQVLNTNNPENIPAQSSNSHSFDDLDINIQADIIPGQTQPNITGYDPNGEPYFEEAYNEAVDYGFDTPNEDNFDEYNFQDEPSFNEAEFEDNYNEEDFSVEYELGESDSYFDEFEDAENIQETENNSQTVINDAQIRSSAQSQSEYNAVNQYSKPVSFSEAGLGTTNVEQEAQDEIEVNYQQAPSPAQTQLENNYTNVASNPNQVNNNYSQNYAENIPVTNMPVNYEQQIYSQQQASQQQVYQQQVYQQSYQQQPVSQNIGDSPEFYANSPTMAQNNIQPNPITQPVNNMQYQNFNQQQDTCSSQQSNSSAINNLSVDTLTKVYDRNAYEIVFANISQNDLAIIYLDVNNLKTTNDTLGHNYGNKLLTESSNKLSELFPKKVFRIGGDEFVVLLNGEGPEIVRKKIQTFNSYMKKLTDEDPDGIIYQVAIGIAFGDGIMSKKEIEEKAESLMYANKKALKAASLKKDPRSKESQEEALIRKNPYNPNNDGYYNDRLPELLDEITKTSHTDTILRIVLVIIAMVAVIVYSIFYVKV